MQAILLSSLQFQVDHADNERFVGFRMKMTNYPIEISLALLFCW